MSARISGLNDQRAAHARALINKAAKAMVANKEKVHYSQQGNRWVGIDRKLSITDGRYPTTSDCSSSSTWMLWDALCRPYGVRDLVNGAAWKAGYTGTMYKRGKAVVHDKNLKTGDLIFYGDQGGGIPQHVCVYLSGGMVFSHGSEGGPYILKIDYRSDRRMSRRYI